MLFCCLNSLEKMNNNLTKLTIITFHLPALYNVMSEASVKQDEVKLLSHNLIKISLPSVKFIYYYIAI